MFNLTKNRLNAKHNKLVNNDLPRIREAILSRRKADGDLSWKEFLSEACCLFDVNEVLKILSAYENTEKCICNELTSFLSLVRTAIRVEDSLDRAKYFTTNPILVSCARNQSSKFMTYFSIFAKDCPADLKLDLLSLFENQEEFFKHVIQNSKSDWVAEFYCNIFDSASISEQETNLRLNASKHFNLLVKDKAYIDYFRKKNKLLYETLANQCA